MFDLAKRIHKDFAYDPAATTIDTAVEDVLERRRGVCQDFAHVQIGCLRSLGLARAYVSGYLARTARPGNRDYRASTRRTPGSAFFAPTTAGSISIRPTAALSPTGT